MTTLTQAAELLTEEEYLDAERLSETKHEFLGGVIYAMAGASLAHNTISTNLVGLLHQQLRGKKCGAFGSDMKVRLRNIGDTYFYYPDAMVACDPTGVGDGWCERPALLFEILSEDTRRVDEREKRLNYLQIPTLEAYVRIEQKCPEVVVERRSGDTWRSEKITGLDAILELPGVGIRIPLADLYERLSF